MMSIADRDRRALCLKYALTPSSTNPIKREKKRARVEKKIAKLYAHENLPCPRFEWLSSFDDIDRTIFFTKNEGVGPYLGAQFFPENRLKHVALNDIAARLVPEEATDHFRTLMRNSLFSSTGMALSDHPLRDIHLKLTKRVLVWWPFRNVCYVMEKFTSIALDGQLRLHSVEGPALEFGSIKLFAFAGTAFPGKYLEARNDFHEIRRLIAAKPDYQAVLIDIYGREKFISHGSSYSRNKYGTTYIVEMPIVDIENYMNIPPACFVKVTNTTPNKDGIHEETYLRIPRELVGSPLAAVAWTFGMTKEEYQEGLLEES